MSGSGAGKAGFGYRRFLVDLHVADWNHEFLADLDERALMRDVASTGATSTNVPANAHTGLTYWPSAVGRQHAAIQGDDLFGRFVGAARDAGLDPVAYYCTIYVDWYWDTHPQARVVDATGARRKVTMLTSGAPRRFSCCCPNNRAYREFCRVQLAELVRGYDIAGVNLDMTFWPTVCYCATCEKRARDELGAPIPRKVDWADSQWLDFVRRRQEWLVEFIDELSAPVRDADPELVLLHQSQAYTQDWFLGASTEAAARTDWLAADLYRGREELSFVFKLFNSLTSSHPFEQISTWKWPDIYEDTTVRTDSELEEIAFLPLTNDAAITFIEAPDPRGRHSIERYPSVRRIFDRIGRIEHLLGGDLEQDVGIYVSFDASFDLSETGRDVADFGFAFEPSRPSPARSAHRCAAASAAATLMQRHLPYGVVTRNDLERLSRWQVIVLPNVALLDETECVAFARFVEGGGRLYVSGATSLLDWTGEREDLGLSCLLGVRREGVTAEKLTFATPTAEGAAYFGEFSSHRPFAVHAEQQLVRLTDSDATVLATVTLPYTDPTETRYAIIVNDPPGQRTDFPSVIARRVGDGRIVYAAGALESERHSSQRDVFAALIRSLLHSPPAFAADGPGCVELTLFDRRDLGSLVLFGLNIQSECPPLPVEGMVISLSGRGRRFRCVSVQPDETGVAFSETADGIQFEAPRFERLLTIRIDYEVS